MFRRLLFALLAAVALTACASAPEVPLIGGSPAKSAAAKGGDAEGSATGVDTVVGYAAPGATQVNAPNRNEDRLQASQAAPGFTLNLAVDWTSIIKADPVAQSHIRALTQAEDEVLRASKRLENAEGAEAGSAADRYDRAITRADTMRDKLSVYIKELRDSTGGGGGASVEALYFIPIVFMSNAEDAAKLDAVAIEKTALVIEQALKPAVKALE